MRLFVADRAAWEACHDVRPATPTLAVAFLHRDGLRGGLVKPKLGQETSDAETLRAIGDDVIALATRAGMACGSHWMEAGSVRLSVPSGFAEADADEILQRLDEFRQSTGGKPVAILYEDADTVPGRPGSGRMPMSSRCRPS